MPSLIEPSFITARSMPMPMDSNDPAMSLPARCCSGDSLRVQRRSLIGLPCLSSRTPSPSVSL